jgi:pimeloyl-ACP methyl ester carboxylesterase
MIQYLLNADPFFVKSNNTDKTPSFPVNLVVILLSLVTPLFAKAQNNIIENNPSPKGSIHEQKFVLINGIEQWVTIKGARSKPVILFLHGGPGSPMSPYSDTLFRDWEKDFIIVQWDQRGTGKTFGNTAPEELTLEYIRSTPLMIEQMTADGIQLSEYLVKHLGKQKIILFGTSWGSALGARMATERPDLYYAYVGHSQIVDPRDDLLLYNKVYKMAGKNDDLESLKILDTLGKPPYNKAKDIGMLLRIVKKYERANSTPPPGEWFIASPGYDNVKDNQHRSDGDDYSFINYIGDKGLGIPSMRSTINMLSASLDFKIPVYLIQGNEDLLTPKEMTEDYFSKIKAPEKKYFLLPKTAHGFNLSVLETLYEICKRVTVK